MKKDSSLYTILFSIGMVVIVGALLAFFSNFTEKKRIDNDKVKAKVDILSSIGIEANRQNATELFQQYIKQQYVIQGIKATKNPEAYLIDIKKEQEQAKEGKIQRLPLFIAEKNDKKIYILPVRGNGLWDAIWGYVALKSDLKTIYGVFFDHKGETPGLGANITQPFFEDDFQGEKIYDKQGNYRSVTVSKTNNDPKNKDKEDNEVDAIAGATITSNGVTAMLKSGIKIYLPYFKTLQNT